MRGILGRRYSGPIEGRQTYAFPGHCLRCFLYQEARELAGRGEGGEERFRLQTKLRLRRRTDQLSPNPHSRFEKSNLKNPSAAPTIKISFSNIRQTLS